MIAGAVVSKLSWGRRAKTKAQTRVSPTWARRAVRDPLLGGEHKYSPPDTRQVCKGLTGLLSSSLASAMRICQPPLKSDTSLFESDG